MKIYVVSNSVLETPEQLIKQLSQIKIKETRASSVIVVDKRYNIEDTSKNEASILNTSYHLDDFLHEKGSITDRLIIDANQIATKLNILTTDWVIFEFSQNDQTTCLEFIQKLANYNYTSPRLRERNVVFSVPDIFLTSYARKLNESFNNLPTSSLVVAQSGQVGMLLLSARTERLFVNSLLLSSFFIRLGRLSKLIYRRIIQAQT